MKKKCKKIVREIREEQTSSNVVVLASLERLEDLIKDLMDKMVIMEGYTEVFSSLISQLIDRVRKIEKSLNIKSDEYTL